MLLTIKQMKFLASAVEKDEAGNCYAKEGLSDVDKKTLVEIDELNFITYEQHLITNYEELKK